MDELLDIQMVYVANMHSVSKIIPKTDWQLGGSLTYDLLDTKHNIENELCRYMFH